MKKKRQTRIDQQLKGYTVFYKGPELYFSGLASGGLKTAVIPASGIQCLLLHSMGTCYQVNILPHIFAELQEFFKKETQI